MNFSQLLKDVLSRYLSMDTLAIILGSIVATWVITAFLSVYLEHVTLSWGLSFLIVLSTTSFFVFIIFSLFSSRYVRLQRFVKDSLSRYFVPFVSIPLTLFSVVCSFFALLKDLTFITISIGLLGFLPMLLYLFLYDLVDKAELGKVSLFRDMSNETVTVYRQRELYDKSVDMLKSARKEVVFVATTWIPTTKYMEVLAKRGVRIIGILDATKDELTQRVITELPKQMLPYIRVTYEKLGSLNMLLVDNSSVLVTMPVSRKEKVLHSGIYAVDKTAISSFRMFFNGIYDKSKVLQPFQ